MYLRADNFVVSDRIWPKFKLIQAFIYVADTCKKIQSQMKALEWPQHVPHYISLEIFRAAQGHLSPQSVVGSGRSLKPCLRISMFECVNTRTH